MANEGFRSQVLDAALKLFRENGWGAVTMDDVARSVGKGKSTLYYYFKSKEEIFNAVLESEIRGVILETVKRISTKDGLPGKLKAFAATKFEMTLKRKSLYKSMEVGMDAEVFSKYTDVKMKVHQQYLKEEVIVMQQLLFAAMANGEIRKMNSEKVDELIFVFLSSTRGINREVIVHGSSGQGMKLVYAFCDLFFDGIR